MTSLRDSRDRLVAPVDWTQYPDWVRDRVIEKGLDPDLVIRIVLGQGALGEIYVQRVDIGALS